MGKKKKKKKQPKQLGFDALLENGKTALEAGKARPAIDAFKSALKCREARGNEDAITADLARAYLLREQELRVKGMDQEADMVKAMAGEHLSGIEVEDEETLLAVIQGFDDAKAFETYDRYFERQGPSAAVELLLVDRLAANGCWESLDACKSPIKLKKDAGQVRQAVVFMDQGDWQEALAALGRLPRSSPFSHIRLFCRAMTGFYQGNTGDVEKCAQMIPEGSVFGRIARAIHTKPLAEAGQDGGISALSQCLWTGPFDGLKAKDAILACCRSHQFNDRMANAVNRFTRSVFNGAFDLANQAIFETVYLYRPPGLQYWHQFSNAAKKLLKKRADLVFKKTSMIADQNPLVGAGEYLAVAAKDFPDPEAAGMAKAMTIHFALKRFTGPGEDPPDYSVETADKLTKMTLGIRSDHTETNRLEMIRQGLRFDPKNPELYALALAVPAHDRESSKLKAAILEARCTALPRDPQPLLELAWHHHEKNAYRKAEAALKQAMALAPHDSSVLYRHALSLLISADRNANKKKFHLAGPDVEKAMALGSSLKPWLFMAKQLMFTIGEKPEMPQKILSIRLEPFGVKERLKILTLMLLDIMGRPWPEQKKIERKIQAVFFEEIGQVKVLSSPEVASLLMPFPKEWKFLFKIDMDPAGYFLYKHPFVFNLMEDQDLLLLLDVMAWRLYPNQLTAMLDKRLRTKWKKDYKPAPVLKFYYAVIKHICGMDDTLQRIRTLVSQADEATLAAMKAASAKLSRHAWGWFRIALERFEFDEAMPDDYPDDDFYDDDFDDDDDEGYNPFTMPGEIPPEFMADIVEEIAVENPRLYKATVKSIKEMLRNLDHTIGELGLRGVDRDTLLNTLEKFEGHGIVAELLPLVKAIQKNKNLGKFSREIRLLFDDQE